MKLRLQFILSAYGAILGAFVAILSFLFIVTINQLIGVLWNNPHDAFPNPSYWPLIICPIGGIFVGLTQKYLGAYPSEMNEIMGEFQKKWTHRIPRTHLAQYCSRDSYSNIWS